MIFLFEIIDKMIPVQSMYLIFLTFGGIGLLLGCFRWWLSAIWLVVPTLLFSFFFIIGHLSDLNLLYDDVIPELGISYIWHSYISMIIGISLNLLGLMLGYKKQKILLK